MLSQACESLLKYCLLYCEEALRLFWNSAGPACCGCCLPRTSQLFVHFCLLLEFGKKMSFCYCGAGMKISQLPQAFSFTSTCGFDHYSLQSSWECCGRFWDPKSNWDFFLSIFCFISLGTVVWTSDTSHFGEENISRGQPAFYYCSAWPKYMVEFAFCSLFTKLSYVLKLFSVSASNG